MAGNIANLKPWPKGVSGNPNGTRRIPDDLRSVDSLSQKEITKLISKLARMSDEEALVYLSNPKLPKLHRAMMSVLDRSIENGDFTRLSFLLDRAIGRIPVIVEDDEDLSERAELSKIPLREFAKLILNNLEEK